MKIRKDLFATASNQEFRLIELDGKSYYEIFWHFDDNLKKMIYCQDRNNTNPFPNLSTNNECSCNCSRKVFARYYLKAIDVKTKKFHYITLGKSSFNKHLNVLVDSFNNVFVDNAFGLGKKFNFKFLKEIEKVHSSMNVPISCLKPTTKEKNLKLTKKELKDVEKDAVNLEEFFALKNIDKSKKRFPEIKESEMIFFK